VILLDTNAVIWIQQNHPRARDLLRASSRKYVSPASLLEVQFLVEAGRIRLRRGASVSDVAADPRWVVDSPPSAPWFAAALDTSFTRDPFDRLIVAHASLRGWRLATGDRALCERLGPAATIEL
jgi:PIN domain nuclease of toxin-antitoxin system